MEVIRSIKNKVKSLVKQKLPKPVTTPTVLQMEAVECGAAALAIILGYHGRHVPLEKLRVACGVSRDGLKATNLMKGARAYGLEAKGYAKSIEKLKEVEMPCIIFWNFNHFLVLEGFTEKRVYLSDPAQGRYWVDHEEFNESFTGVTICLKPGPDFERKSEKPSLLRSLHSRITHSKLSITFIILASLFLVIPGLIIPSFTQIFIDHYLINNISSFVMPLILGMILIMIINTGLTFVQQYYLLRLDTKLALSTSSKFLWHVFHLPISFFTQRSAGDIGNRVSLNDKVANLLSGQLANSLLSVVVIIFYAIVMFSYDVKLTFIGIAAAVLNVLALKIVSRARVDGNRRLTNEGNKLMGNTMSGISMIETLKASGRESDFFANWSGYLAKVLNGQQDLAVITLKFSMIPPLLMSFTNTLVISFGALQVMEGQLTIGMLVAFIYLMNSFMGPVNQLVSVGSTLQETEGDMNVIDDVLNYEIDEALKEVDDEISIEKSNARLVGDLELRNLTFGYSTALEPLIEDFSMKLKPGSRIALVGGSGSGKSTVARLVSGLYAPWEGEILFDGVEREDIPRYIINNSLAVIDQDIMMFKGSVKQNISFWDSSVPDIDVVNSAKDACIHDVVATRTASYDSVVAEGGTNFSGGQKQRLEIARALACNPSILVMDEATSALDPQTEKTVMDNIRRRGCTCLVVAHRLSTIRDCDEIIVMHLGKIVERGTHEELLELGGKYSDLISSK